jgi:hypothetical protein
MSRSIKHLSIVLTALYLAVASVAAYCMTSHAVQHSPIPHQSKNTISHSSLCSLACQVSSKPTSADASEKGLMILTLLLAGTVFLKILIPVQATLHPTSARGPPV